MIKNNRTIGGGKLFFTPDGGGSEVEIGEVQEASLSFDVSTADAFSKDQVMKKRVDQVVTDISGKISFSTQITNAHNTAMAMLGAESTETFAVDDELPDGTTATVETVIPVIAAGSVPIIKGQLKFVGDEDGDTKPVLIVYSASIKPSGDIGYISEEFTTLEFEGEILDTVNGYAKEYRMAVS